MGFLLKFIEMKYHIRNKRINDNITMYFALTLLNLIGPIYNKVCNDAKQSKNFKL